MTDVAMEGVPIEATRAAQQAWCRVTLSRRLAMVKKFRHELVARQQAFLDSVHYPHRNDRAETLAAELIPLADACRFVEREAKSILRTRRKSNRSRPIWLRGVSLETQRDPWGVVLIVGASNYPLFLTGVQTIQALVAGNAVMIKPGIGATAATLAIRSSLIEAGLDPALCCVLPEDASWVGRAIDQGVDHVLLTGSFRAGHAIQAMAADKMIPVTMELSGCDAVFLLDDMDTAKVAKALAFGLRFNNSATCIAPRRVFVPRQHQAALERDLLAAIGPRSADSIDWSDDAKRLLQRAVSRGARLLGDISLEAALSSNMPLVIRNASAKWDIAQASLFEPILLLIPIDSANEATAWDADCPYALGATVFGQKDQATELARSIDAGCVVINDMIAPTADPRIAFGGRRQSGFGVTRGAEGLLAMTQIKTIVHQRSRFQPHLESPSPHDEQLLGGFLALSHAATWKTRCAGLWQAIKAGIAQHHWKQQDSSYESMESKSCQTTNGSQSSAAA